MSSERHRSLIVSPLETLVAIAAAQAKTPAISPLREIRLTCT